MSTIAASIRDLLGAILLPATCCLCGSDGMRLRVDLCAICADLLPANPPDWHDFPPPFKRALVPFRYEYPVDRFVRALKFRGDRLYARLLGTLLADAQRARDSQLPEVLIPVPLHDSRYRQRGFNQAFEIARFAAACLGTHVEPACLRRVNATVEQSGLSLAARQRNVRGAFRLVQPLEARHVALVDDVFTTGNTASEAARVIAASGIEDIELWAAARVPAPRHMVR